jgi:hypothetical protein
MYKCFLGADLEIDAVTTPIESPTNFLARLLKEVTKNKLTISKSQIRDTLIVSYH